MSAAGPAAPAAPDAPVAKKPESLLLITGARSLADFPESQDWAEALLAALIAPGDWDVVLSGGCKDSPDAWATEIATSSLIAWVEYRLDGKRVGSDGKTYAWWKQDSRCHPHQRNQAMVDLVKKQQLAGWKVQVAGFRAAWATTRGTGVTLDMARKAGLPVIDQECPASTTEKACVCGRGMTRRSTCWTCICGKSELR